VKVAKRDNVVDYVARHIREIDSECLGAKALLCIFNESGMFFDKAYQSLMEQINVRELEVCLWDNFDEFEVKTNWGDKARGALVCRAIVERFIAGLLSEREIVWYASKQCSGEALEERYHHAITDLFNALRNPTACVGSASICMHKPAIVFWYWKRVSEYAEEQGMSHVSLTNLKRFEDNVLREEIRTWMDVYDKLVHTDEWSDDYRGYRLEEVDSYGIADALLYDFVWDRVVAAMEYERQFC
jgi:hypothetical protein